MEAKRRCFYLIIGDKERTYVEHEGKIEEIMSKETAQEQVAQQIENAFNDLAYPGDDNLVIRLQHPYDLHLKIDFEGKHWKEISSTIVVRHKFDMSRFTPEAFRFYLPAYLIASLIGDDRGEVIVHVIYYLDPQEDQGSKRDEFITRIEPLTLKQKLAVKSFIQLYLETEPHLIDRDERMRRFWEHYPA